MSIYLINPFLYQVVATPGQQEYTTPGTYTWVAPAGVTKVSIVAIGGGARHWQCHCGCGARGLVHGHRRRSR